jgi:hypothetical protein
MTGDGRRTGGDAAEGEQAVLRQVLQQLPHTLGQRPLAPDPHTHLPAGAEVACGKERAVNF